VSPAKIAESIEIPYMGCGFGWVQISPCEENNFDRENGQPTVNYRDSLP